MFSVERRQGFTLVELVAAVLIVAALVVLILPLYVGHLDSGQSRVLCYNNLKSMSLSLLQYRLDHDEKFPLADGHKNHAWAKVIQPYFGQWDMFHCPSTQSLSPKSVDYFYNARLAGKRPTDLKFPRLAIVIGDGENDSPLGYTLKDLPADWKTDKSSPSYRHHNDATYAFVEGNVRWLKPSAITDGSIENSKAYFSFK